MPSLFKNQVLSSAPINHDLNFGLKHALPRSNHAFVTVKELDDPILKKPKLLSAWRIIAKDQVWMENFGNFKTAISFSESVSADSIVKSAKYKDLLNQAKVSRKSDLHSFIIENMPKSVKKNIHPPWFDPITQVEGYSKVKGRILNKVSGGYSVGISGIVAFLPNEYYSHQAIIDQITKRAKISQKAHLGPVTRKVDRESVYEFYVVLARYDHLLRPEVILSTLPPLEQEKFDTTKTRKRSDNMINLMKILSKKT